MKNLRTKLRLGAVGLVFLIAGSAWATDFNQTWTGGGQKTDDGYYIFEDANNWSPAKAISLTGTDRWFLTFPEQDSDESVEAWSTKPNAAGMPVKFKRAGTASTGENVRL